MGNKISNIYLGAYHAWPMVLPTRTTLPMTPDYNDDTEVFHLAFIPKDDPSYYAGYLIGETGSGLYVLDLYDNSSSRINLGVIGSSTWGSSQMGLNIAKGNQVIHRIGQNSNLYGVYDFTNQTPTYTTVTATGLPTNTYADFSYINTYSNIFLQKDGNTSGSQASATWRNYDWENKSVITIGNLSNVGQTAFGADDPINPNFLRRAGGSNYMDKYNTIFKYDVANDTMTQLSATLPYNCAINFPFYYNDYVFFPLEPEYSESTDIVYKFDTVTETGTLITLPVKIGGYRKTRNFYLGQYLYIFPDNAQGVVIDMSVL